MNAPFALLTQVFVKSEPASAIGLVITVIVWLATVLRPFAVTTQV